jgi:hypothetical protein
MKFGIRGPSLGKRIAARTSPARAIRHRLGLKAPRGAAWLTDPKRAAYNRIYSRTSVAADSAIGIIVIIAVGVAIALWRG